MTVRLPLEKANWQPIDTAPKGHDSLLFSENFGISLGDWGDYCQYNHPQWTHWMPLPEAPK